MDALEEATAVLRTAERQLRTILAHAAEGGKYDQLPQIAEWAKLLNVAAGGQSSVEPPAVRTHPPAMSDSGIHERPVEAMTKAPASGHRKAKAGPRKKPRRSKTAKPGYPKFVREGESLVKIGWSKSEGKTYEHKAPLGVLKSLVQTLVRVGSGGERFKVEALLPLKDAERSDIPDYQTYLALAWLRSADLITQHGRQGYSLPTDSNIERESERLWGEMTAR